MTAEKFSSGDLRFQACLAFTLKYEGRKSDDPRDPGGRTMEGVTQATYDAYCDRRGAGHHDVYAMLPAERDEIYRNEYWDLVNGDGLRSGEDLCIFDFAVNSGVARARGLSAVWRTSPVNDAIAGICARRLSFLHALRTWSYFGAAWGRRVAACEALAIRMANGKIAPEVLARKAGEANFHSGKKTTQAAVGGAIMGSATIAHALHGGMSGAAEIVILAAVAALVGVFIFHAWRQSQRADALTAAIKDMQARAAALKASRDAEAAQKAAVAANIAKQQQQLKTAEAAEAALRDSPAQSTPSASNKEFKK